ncbi:MAG: triose-phosphate isomerase [Neisseriaceae bacterium]
MKGLQKLILGNWKMNGSLAAVEAYFSSLLSQTFTTRHTIGLAVPFLYQQAAQKYLSHLGWWSGVQDVSQFATAGAYTGEISANMLKDCRTKFALVGHSERRKYFQEDNALIRRKLLRLVECSVQPVLCIGEKWEDSEKGLTESVLKCQLSILEGIELIDLIVAYEPVWAIGSGRIPTLEEIETRAGYIRQRILSRGIEADRMAVLYGGSVNSMNASSITSLPSVEGLLVGGSSLKPQDFVEVIQAV